MVTEEISSRINGGPGSIGIGEGACSLELKHFVGVGIVGAQEVGGGAVGLHRLETI